MYFCLERWSFKIGCTLPCHGTDTTLVWPYLADSWYSLTESWYSLYLCAALHHSVLIFALLLCGSILLSHGIHPTLVWFSHSPRATVVLGGRHRNTGSASSSSSSLSTSLSGCPQLWYDSSLSSPSLPSPPASEIYKPDSAICVQNQGIISLLKPTSYFSCLL